MLLLAAVARAGDVEQRVATIVASLTRQEKLELMNGVGWDEWDIQDGYYVGNLLGAPGKGLPPLKMHDAGQGFRTHDPRVVGTVTSWPCALALASTFDRKQVKAFANAAAQASRGLVREAWQRNSLDNLTALTVVIKPTMAWFEHSARRKDRRDDYDNPAKRPRH